MNQTPDDHPLDLISAYDDGELDPTALASVERHLKVCTGCRRLLEEIRALASAVAAEEPPPVPSDLAARIRLRLPAGAPAERHPARRPWWWSPLPLSAAAAVIIGGALFLATSSVWRAPREAPLVARGTAASPAPPEALPPEAAPPPRLSADLKKKDAERENPATGFAPSPSGEAGTGIEARGMPRPSAPGPIASPKAQPESRIEALRVLEDSRGDRATGAAIREEKAAAGSDASRQGVVRPGGRVLVLRTPFYEVEILETGTLTLKAEAYTCVQDLGRPGSAVEADADAVREDRPPDPMAPGHLFGLASTADFLSAPDSPSARGDSGRLAYGTATSRLVLSDSGRKTVHAVAFGGLDDRDAAPVVREIATTIDRLVRERLRPSLEHDCGPLPPGIR